jgi:hypothetical protein
LRRQAVRRRGCQGGDRRHRRRRGFRRSRWQTYVLLPNLKTALVAVPLPAFALSFGETISSLSVVGDTNSLAIRLCAMPRVCFTPEINALSTSIPLFPALLAVIMARFVGRVENQFGVVVWNNEMMRICPLQSAIRDPR